MVCGPSFYEVLEAQTLDYKLYMLLMTQISVVDGPTLYEVHEAEALNYMSLMTQISVVCVASVYMKSLEPRLWITNMFLMEMQRAVEVTMNIASKTTCRPHHSHAAGYEVVKATPIKQNSYR